MATTLLFYKQRHNPPNLKKTAGRNEGHIYYIGNRPGVMKKDGYDNGLFGYIQNSYHEAFTDRMEAESRVYAMSKQKKTVFRSIISFTGKQAEGLGLYTQDDWQKYVKTHIPTISKEMGINLNNLEYVAAVHNKKNQPHVHIAFWDKSNAVQKQFVHESKVEHLRGMLIKETYPELVKEFYDKKSISEKEFRECFTSIMKEYEEYLLSMPSSNYLLYRDEVKSDERAKAYAYTDLDIKHNSICLNILAKEFFEVKDSLPKTGRLNYKLLPSECKEKLDSFVDLIISSNEKFEKALVNYVSSKLDIAEIYTSDFDKLSGKENEYTKEAKNIIANIVLRSIKELNINEINAYFSSYNQNYETEQLLKNILFFFSSVTRKNYQKSNYFNSVSAMSKEAKKEFMNDLKDRGIGVER